MSDSEIPRADHPNMDERTALAEEFFSLTKPELIPFVSDEASWLDFDYLEFQELSTLVEEHYGIVLEESSLRLPFWRFLDFLAENRRGGAEPF
jgi:hypothetical protein